MNVQSVFILVSVLIKQITTSENIPPQSRESRSMEMEIVFTELFSVIQILMSRIHVGRTSFKMMTYHDAQGIIEIPLTSLTLTLIVGKL